MMSGGCEVEATAVVVIVNFTHIKDCEERREGRMHRTNSIFEQTPPPHFCLKVVCKKWSPIFWEPTILFETGVCGYIYLLMCNIPSLPEPGPHSGRTMANPPGSSHVENTTQKVCW